MKLNFCCTVYTIFCHRWRSVCRMAARVLSDRNAAAVTDRCRKSNGLRR